MLFIPFLFHAQVFSLESATCYFENGQPKILHVIDKSKGYAWASWDDMINSTGTSHITIETTTNDSLTTNSTEKLFCAGYVDGYLMQYRIWNRWLLQKDILGLPRDEEIPETWTNWFQGNIDYTFKQIEQNPNDPYWKSIGLVAAQFKGLQEGYMKAVNDKGVQQEMSIMHFWILQSIGDIYDLKVLWDEKRDPLNFMECTGLVTILDDYSEVFFGQDTWSDYRKMSNTVKEYIFKNIPEWNTTHVEVSTKIGALPSSEDFWVASSGLMILETTINNKNTTLQHEVDKSQTKLMTWLRNMHATFVAQTGEQWADEFLKENSGTYNNQYVIVDSKKLTPGVKPTKDLLWVTETMPGIAVKADLTQVLADNLFFPSFNTPYFEEIQIMANYTNNVADNSSYYYNETRYLILKREAPQVKSIEDFQKLMRLNNYLNEPVCNDPSKQVMSRYDLKDRIGLNTSVAFGGLDTKVTSAWRTLNNLSFIGIWSPVYDDKDLPPWDFDEWSEKHPDKVVKHDGLPSKWTFNWTDFGSEDYNRCGVATSKDDCLKLHLCGWCYYDTACYPGTKSGPALDIQCQAGWRYPAEEKPWAASVIISISVISVVFCFAIYAYNVYLYTQKKKQQQYNYI